MKNLKISKQEYEYEILEEGLRLKDGENDRLIPHSEMISIRYISLFKIEMAVYVFISILAFNLWFVIGIVISLYTIFQILMNYRAILITSKGNLILKFQTFGDKEYFIDTLKSKNNSIFKISKWFKFGKNKDQVKG